MKPLCGSAPEIDIEKAASGFGATLAEAALLEGHAYSPLFAPDDAAWPLQLVRLHSEGEAVGNKERGYDFKRCAGFRDVANGTGNCAAAELDRSGLQYTAALRDAGKCHPTDIRLNYEQTHKGDAR
jgi:hypothetical protein